MKHEFPTGDGPLDPSWTAPLTSLARAVAGDPRHRYLDPDDFMIMGRVVRSPRPSINLYKHGYTRHYLNLDAHGQAYRYRAPRDLDKGDGRYLRYRTVDEALLALDLFELPWMKPGLAAERRGLDWEERWTLQDRLLDDTLSPDPTREDLSHGV